jgi:hypothetical protein
MIGVDKRGIRFHVRWTRDFIRDFGWGEYWRVCWRDDWAYRLRNWRCFLYGHALGLPREYYELDFTGPSWELWRECERPNCEYCERTDES